MHSHSLKQGNIDFWGAIVKFIEFNDIFLLEQKECKKESSKQGSASHKQDDHGELSIQPVKSKYGLDWQQKYFW